MRNTIKILGIIALVAVIGFTVVACGGGGGKIPNGKYVDSDGNYFVFSGNKVSKYFDGDDLWYEGTYTIKDNMFTATNKDGKQEEMYLFNISGKTITLGVNDKYEKQ